MLRRNELHKYDCHGTWYNSEFFDDNNQCWGAIIKDVLIRWISIYYL
jgi:hypothetical protein